MTRWHFLAAVGTLVAGLLLTLTWAAPARSEPPANSGRNSAQPGRPDDNSDLEFVDAVLAARKQYQEALERLRAHYLAVNDTERVRWVEEELLHFHRQSKRAYNLKKDVPPPTLQASKNIPEANELFRRAMAYKDHGYGQDYLDNQHRAELILQQILTTFPDSDKIGDVAYQLGDLYEGRAYKHYRRSAAYFERSIQWSPNTRSDARIRAARIYDRFLADRNRAIELYRDVISHETDEARRQEATRRLAELTGQRR